MLFYHAGHLGGADLALYRGLWTICSVRSQYCLSGHKNNAVIQRVKKKFPLAILSAFFSSSASVSALALFLKFFTYSAAYSCFRAMLRIFSYSNSGSVRVLLKSLRVRASCRHGARSVFPFLYNSIDIDKNSVTESASRKTFAKMEQRHSLSSPRVIQNSLLEVRRNVKLMGSTILGSSPDGGKQSQTLI